MIKEYLSGNPLSNKTFDQESWRDRVEPEGGLVLTRV